ncbi:hypothetical protein CFIMG_002084RA [Ceratocystis fimbriata CBS 114723]|uniref:Dienelactone hydrolase domain-containing protein n=1 Tax=Ceratocystis fimbriata CBS 114723 TaxID=1035309 RepID=A0A2C5X8J2_9PEZI|nr:hypothetical protein CFIMG_002084RA [Ceratocystis fimbriata CBS 114723]
MACDCANCTWGSLPKVNNLTGTIETIAGILCYVARPSDVGYCLYTSVREPIGVIVILPDMFGWEMAQTRALADHYAQRIPAVVVVPDLFNGYSVPSKFLHKLDRLHNHPKKTISHKLARAGLNLTIGFHCIPLFLVTWQHSYDRKLARLLQTLRTLPLTSSGLSLKLNRVGVAGFSYGGKTAIRLSHGPLWRYSHKAGFLEPLVDCSFSAQPPHVSLRDLEKVQLPLSIASSHNSEKPLGYIYSADRVLNCEKDNCEFVVYMDAGPGLGIRADPGEKMRVRESVLAQHQAVLWFTRHLPAKEFAN